MHTEQIFELLKLYPNIKSEYNTATNKFTLTSVNYHSLLGFKAKYAKNAHFSRVGLNYYLDFHCLSLPKNDKNSL